MRLAAKFARRSMERGSDVSDSLQLKARARACSSSQCEHLLASAGTGKRQLSELLRLPCPAARRTPHGERGSVRSRQSQSPLRELLRTGGPVRSRRTVPPSPYRPVIMYPCGPLHACCGPLQSVFKTSIWKMGPAPGSCEPLQNIFEIRTSGYVSLGFEPLTSKRCGSSLREPDANCNPRRGDGRLSRARRARAKGEGRRAPEPRTGTPRQAADGGSSPRPLSAAAVSPRRNYQRPRSPLWHPADLCCFARPCLLEQ